MQRNNVTAALAFIAFGVWYAYLTSNLTERTLPNTPGPSFLPWLLTISLLLLSAALLIRGFTPSRGEEQSSGEPNRFTSKAAAPGLILFIVYLIALPFAGFLLASIPFFAGLMAVSGERRKPLILTASIGIPLFLFFLFQFVLQIPMPKSSLLD